ncbi:MAG: hypothetical protein ABIS01_15060 [Ferruginibacter sp.]
MKKIVIGIIAFTAFIFSARAQDKDHITHHGRFHGKHATMFKELNLTTAQKEQLKAGKENTKKQLSELRKNEDITVREFKARKAAILEADKAGVAKVLTVEQKNQLAQNRLKFKEKREEFAAKRLEKMKTKLNLSDDQVAKIKADRETSKAKVKAVMENNQISQAEKKEQLMALRQAQKNNFKQVLTPEQINKMEALKKERMDKKSIR